MKTMTLIQIFIFIGIVSFSCQKENNTHKDDDSTQITIIQLPVYDSLKGNWNWYATYDAKKGMIKNDYQLEIRFTKLNNDSTVSFETYRNDILKEKSKLKISTNSWGRKMEPKVILQFTVENLIYFKFLSRDTIQLYEACDDCSIYYYTKQK